MFRPPIYFFLLLPPIHPHTHTHAHAHTRRGQQIGSAKRLLSFLINVGRALARSRREELGLGRERIPTIYLYYYILDLLLPWYDLCGEPSAGPIIILQHLEALLAKVLRRGDFFCHRRIPLTTFSLLLRKGKASPFHLDTVPDYHP